MPGTPGHRLLQFGGRTVASLQQIADGSDVWVPVVSVQSVDRTTADAISLGAALVDKADIAGLGGWRRSGRQPVVDRGAHTQRRGRARILRTSLRLDHVDTSFEPFATYTVFKRGDVQEGGMLRIGDDWDLSPRWNPSFAVDNCDATLARAKPLGGSTEFVHTVPKHGRIGSLNDPGSAVFVMRGPVP